MQRPTAAALCEIRFAIILCRFSATRSALASFACHSPCLDMLCALQRVTLNLPYHFSGMQHIPAPTLTHSVLYSLYWWIFSFPLGVETKLCFGFAVDFTWQNTLPTEYWRCPEPGNSCHTRTHICKGAPTHTHTQMAHTWHTPEPHFVSLKLWQRMVTLSMGYVVPTSVYLCVSVCAFVFACVCKCL